VTADDLLQGVHSGDVSTIRDAIRAGVDPDARNADGAPALVVAARLGDFDVVRALLSGGADVRAEDAGDGRTALHWAARGGDAPMIEELFGSGASLDARDHANLTPLHEAVAHGHDGAARLLREYGATDEREKSTNIG
jgi:ankyrin repeat protein